MIKNNRIVNIDILRGVAIIWVLLSHLSFTILQNVSPSWFSAGWVGVDIFFVISGFVVTRSYINYIPVAIFKSMSVKQRFFVNNYYLLRRLVRLQPVAWIWVLIPLILSIYFNTYGYFGTSHNLLNEGVSVFLLYYNYFLSYTGHKILMPFWSLAIEEHYYILLMLLTQISIGRVKISKILILVLLILVLNRIKVVFLTDNPTHVFLFFSQYRMDGLILGSLLAFNIESPLLHKFNTALSKLKTNWILPFLLFLLYGIAVYIEKTQFHFSFGHLLISLLSLLIVWIAILAPQSHPLTSIKQKFLNGLQTIGLRSYSIYLIHFSLILLFFEFKLSYFSQIGYWSGFSWPFWELCFYLVLLFIIVEINYRFIEEKMIVLSKRVKLPK